MKKIAIFSLYAIYFLDIAGFGIVFVIFAPLLIDPASAILPHDLSVGTRNVLLGILFAAYPLIQFFAAPFYGEFSDRLGRKRPLIVSTALTVIAYICSAVAISIGSYLFLLFSRLLAGFAAGNLTIAQAAVSDLVEPKKLPSAMGIFNIAGGLSWVIAPYGGSLLTNSATVSWFGYWTPFILMGVLFTLCLLLFMFAYRETNRPGKAKFDILHIIRDYKEVWSEKSLRTFLLLSFGSLFAWLTYQGFMSTYLDERYHLNELQIGRTFAYFSFFWFLGGLISSQWLLKKFTAKQVLLVPLIIVPIAIALYLPFTTPSCVWVLSACANVSESIVLSCFFTLFAQGARKDQQGKVFGFWNSLMAFSLFATPIVSEVASIIQINTPFIIAVILSIFILICFRMAKVCRP